MYYVLTSEKRRRFTVTKAFDEMHQFVLRNKDAKIRMMGFDLKAKLIDKRKFLRAFYQSSGKSWEDKKKTFDMMEIMVKGYNNKNTFLNSVGLKPDHDKYKQLMAEKL